MNGPTEDEWDLLESFETLEARGFATSTPSEATPVPAQGQFGTPSRSLSTTRKGLGGGRRLSLVCPRPGCEEKNFKDKTLLRNHIQKQHLEKDIIRQLPDDDAVTRHAIVVVVELLKSAAGQTGTKGGGERATIQHLLKEQVSTSNSPSVVNFVGRVASAVGMCVTKMRAQESVDMMGQAVSRACCRVNSGKVLDELAQALEECVEVPADIKHQVKRHCSSLLLDASMSTVKWCTELCKEKINSLPKKAKYATSLDTPMPLSERQAVYHVSGFTVNKAKKRQRLSKSLLPESAVIPQLLEDADRVAEPVRAFTAAQSYGGLIFVGIRYYQFARDVLDIVKGEADLSKLSHDYVLSKVRADQTFMGKWEAIFKDESVSPQTKEGAFQFMIKTLVNTYLKGIVNLLHNCSEGGPLNSQSLRSTLGGQSAL